MGNKRFIKIIQINKNYKILGGQGSRYLPKEMYEAETGCAQTSISIDLETNKRKLEYSTEEEILKKNFGYYQAKLFDFFNI